MKNRVVSCRVERHRGVLTRLNESPEVAARKTSQVESKPLK